MLLQYMLSLNHKFHLSGDGLGELNKMFVVAVCFVLSQMRALRLKLCHLKCIGT